MSTLELWDVVYESPILILVYATKETHSRTVIEFL